MPEEYLPESEGSASRETPPCRPRLRCVDTVDKPDTGSVYRLTTVRRLSAVLP